MGEGIGDGVNVNNKIGVGVRVGIGLGVALGVGVNAELRNTGADSVAVTGAAQAETINAIKTIARIFLVR